MMRSEHLAYFKDLFEGRATISWNAWFRRNAEQLGNDLPRAAFLRLKFKKLDEAENYLKENGIPYTSSPMAKRERYYSILHDSVLDENGRPTMEFRRKAYGGAFGHFYDGSAALAKEAFQKQLKKILRLPTIKRSEEFSDFAFDGEMEFELGEKELGRMMLELVASVEIGDDLIDHAIKRSQELLRLG